MKFNILFLFLFFSTIPVSKVSAQGSSTILSYDSIYSKIKEYSKLKKYSHALKFSHQLLSSGRLIKDNLQKAKAYYTIAVFQDKMAIKDSAFYYYTKANELYQQEGDSARIGRCLLNLAIIESDFGDYANSDLSAIKGLQFLNGKRKNTIVGLYNTLAINSKKQGLYEQAIYNYQKALSFKPKIHASIAIKNNIANVYIKEENYQKGIFVLEKLLKDTIKKKKTKTRVLDNLAHVKWLQNSKSKVLENFLLAKKHREEQQDTYGLLASYSHLSDYFKVDSPQKGLIYAYKMYAIAKKQKAIINQLEAIDKVIALEKPPKAIPFYKEGIRLRDSLSTIRIKEQHKFAKIKYNYKAEAKEKTKFKSLASKNKLLVTKEKNEKYSILLFGFFMMGVFIFLVQKRKKKFAAEVVKETYKIEVELAKKIHDELGNGLFTTLTKVQNENIEKSEILKSLDLVYAQTRNFSHKYSAIETGKKFKAHFYDLVGSYSSQACKVVLKDIEVFSFKKLNTAQQITLYRIVNEMLVNMKKHSDASVVVFSFKKEEKNYLITYFDNGVGFDVSKIKKKNGLLNMETRIKTIEGNLNFENQPTNGCKITISFKI